MEQQSFVLTLSCEDRPGIVASVTTELAALNANIAESNQFWDRQTGRFFMRLAFTAPDGVDRDALERALRPSIERFGMKTALANQARKPRIIIMVSKFDHAMLHLLYQIRVGWLDAEVAGIVSNHADAEKTAAYEGVPFHLWPVTKDTKEEQEAAWGTEPILHATSLDLHATVARWQNLTSNISFSTSEFHTAESVGPVDVRGERDRKGAQVRGRLQHGVAQRRVDRGHEHFSWRGPAWP